MPTSHRHPCQPRRLALACALAWVAAGPATASNYVWNSNDSFWDVVTSWDPNGLPTAASNVQVRPVGGLNTTLRIDDATGMALANSLKLGFGGLTTPRVTIVQTGGILQTTGSEIGDLGAGSFVQVAGEHRAASITIGGSNFATGSYVMDGGSLTATTALTVGLFGDGSFVQNGGTASVSRLDVGRGSGNTGTVTINDGSLAAGTMVVGWGSGMVENLGGSLTVANDTRIGNSGGFEGTLRLAGGNTTLGSVNQTGAAGSSTLVLDGGSLVVTSGFVRATEMLLGRDPGRTGTYSTGTSANVQLERLFVGVQGAGSFVQDGGAVAVSGEIAIGGLGGGASSVYRMSGGTLTAGPMSFVGTDGAVGTFEQNAGVATFSGGVSLGPVGSEGTGRILISGSATLTIDGLLSADTSPGSHEIRVAGTPGVATASLNANGGASLNAATRVVALPAGNINMGPATGGTFVVDGGSLNFFGASNAIDSLRLAETHDSFLSLFGSTVTVSGATVIAAGDATVSELRLGPNSVFRPSSLVLGAGAGSTGILTLDGGALELSGGGLSSLGMPGSSIVQLNSGTLSFNRLSGGARTAAIGVNELRLGQTWGQSFELRVVGAAPAGASLAPNSATTVVVDRLLVGSPLTAGSSLVIDGGIVSVGESATVNHSLNVLRGELRTSGTLDVFGRLNVEDTLQFNGVVNNLGRFTASGLLSGSADSRISNGGNFEQNPAPLQVFAPGGVDNTGLWSTAAGHRLAFTAGTFRNAGTLELAAGSSIVGAGVVQNQALGIIHGAGRIDTGGFSNAGRMVAQGGRIEVVNAFANTGTMVLADDLASYAGGTVTNTGRIEGRGAVFNPVVNSAGGTVEAKGGTLQLARMMTVNAGTLAAQNGASLVLSGGLVQNTGTIRLNGGSVDLGSGTLDHRGQLLASTGVSQVLGAMTAAPASKVIVSGLGSLTFYDEMDFQGGSELRVSAGATATFFGSVRQRTGALFTGAGQKFYESTFTIGGSPGLAIDEGDVSFGSSALVEMEIGGLLPGSGFDQLQVGGTLTYGGTLKIVSWDGFVAQAGQRFDLFDATITLGSFTAIDSSGLALAPGAWLDLASLYVDGSVAVVPEPSRWAMLALGLAGLGIATRRRAAAGHRIAPSGQPGCTFAG